MTPDERQLLTQFLQDLAQARAGPKDPEAATLISQAINANPDAPYLLVQHTVISDQALHAAQARIAELEAQLNNVGQGQSRSFLAGGAGPWGQSQGQGPSTAVPPSDAPPPGGYGYGPPPGGPFSSGGGLGSFLRSAGTTAAGVAGGEMLFEGLSGLFGGHHGMFGGGYGGMGGYAPQETVVNNYYEDDDRGGRDDHEDRDDGGWDDGGGFDDGSGSY